MNEICSCPCLLHGLAKPVGADEARGVPGPACVSRWGPAWGPTVSGADSLSLPDSALTVNVKRFPRVIQRHFITCPLSPPPRPTCLGPLVRSPRPSSVTGNPTQPICGSRSLPEASLGPSCILWGAWAKASPPCPRRDSSPTPGGGPCTPQRVCSHCPTCQSHTAYTGHADCRGSEVRGGTDTANSSPAERGQAVRAGGGTAGGQRAPAATADTRGPTSCRLRAEGSACSAPFNGSMAGPLVQLQ